MRLIANGVKEKGCGVYIISNTLDSRIYIGSAAKFRRRFLDHKEMLRKGKHHSKHLQAFVDKYGVDQLEFTIVYECSNRSLAFDLEQGLINKLKPKFNMTYKVFKHMEGVKVSKESKAKQVKTAYKNFRLTNYTFVKDLVLLSQTVLSNRELASQLNVSESKVVEFKAKRGTFIKRLISEIECTLQLRLNKCTSVQTQTASANTKFLEKYGSVENFRKSLKVVLSRIKEGTPKMHSCIGTLISYNSLYSILNGVSYSQHSTDLLEEFKEYLQCK